MRAKNKKIIDASITQAQFEEALKKYREAEVKEATVKLIIETEVSEVLERHKDLLLCVAQTKRNAFDIAQAYCTTNKKKLFGKRRSLGNVYGKAGFRQGTPRLQLCSGIDWKDVLPVLKKQLPNYVRTVQEPAKDLLIADRHKPEVVEVLQLISASVVQDEIFYVESHNVLVANEGKLQNNKTDIV